MTIDSLHGQVRQEAARMNGTAHTRTGPSRHRRVHVMPKRNRPHVAPKAKGTERTSDAPPAPLDPAVIAAFRPPVPDGFVAALADGIAAAVVAEISIDVARVAAILDAARMKREQIRRVTDSQ